MAYSVKKSIAKGTVPAMAVVAAALIAAALRAAHVSVTPEMETAIVALVAGGVTAVVNWLKNREPKKPQTLPEDEKGKGLLPGTSIPV
jgi:hypothetical protein